MIEILDEITEIPFEVYWDKFNEFRPDLYDRLATEAMWFSMREENRILAFGYLARFGSDYKDPLKHLQQFDLPF